jgi:hypothetical protein
MRKELYAPKYEPASFGGPSSVGKNGWLAEQPLVNADTNRANALIEGICNALSPQPAPRLNIASLRGISPEVVRQKLAQAVAKGRITQAQMEEQLALLGNVDA